MSTGGRCEGLGLFSRSVKCDCVWSCILGGTVELWSRWGSSDGRKDSGTIESREYMELGELIAGVGSFRAVETGALLENPKVDVGGDRLVDDERGGI